MGWKFKREEQQFKQLDEGKYRIRIKSAEKAVSKSSGNDMLALQFEVSGSNAILYHYIVFLDDRPEITNRMLTAFFDSFADIEEGDFNMQNWVGKVGACMVKHDEDDRARISYFIKADKQDELPPWQSADGKDADGFGSLPSTEELPFF